MEREQKKIQTPVIKRLPRYRRYLEDLHNQNVETVSSDQLSVMTGYTSSLIRRDLNNFGAFGRQGAGYDVEALLDELNYLLGMKTDYRMIMVGVGNLGQAIVKYTYYYKIGFRIEAMFDVNPKLVGLRINEIKINDFEELPGYLKDNDIDIGIICANKDGAQKIADILVEGGVKGIWNFAPVDINVPANVSVQNVHVSDSLNLLSYAMNEKMKSKAENMPADGLFAQE